MTFRILPPGSTDVERWGTATLAYWLIEERATEIRLIRRYAFQDDALTGLMLLQNGIPIEVVQNWQHGPIEHPGDPEPKFRYKR
jgi:hypothetical protein